jgi:hypothetical protein
MADRLLVREGKQMKRRHGKRLGRIGMGPRFLFLLCCSSFVPAQNPELGRIERSGNEATLIVDSPRPVDSAASTLAAEFGIRVNVEDPTYIFSDDVRDVTASVSRDAKIPRPVLVPKGGHLEVHLTLGPDGMPTNTPGLLRSLVDAANAQFPFQYRLDVDANWFTIVPTHTRDLLGRGSRPCRCSLPHHYSAGDEGDYGERQPDGAAALRANRPARELLPGGRRMHSLGLAEVSFEANDEPARNVLKRLITAAAVNQPDRDYWLQRSDPLPSTWCFINLAHISRETSAASSQPAARLPNGGPRRGWFVLTPVK